MADARYIFRECVPDGSIDIANELQIINRAWSFRESSSRTSELPGGI